MIRWKNRPIDQLSESELRKALAELAYSTLSRTGEPENLALDSFWTGLFVGATAALLGLAAYSLVLQ